MEAQPLSRRRPAPALRALAGRPQLVKVACWGARVQLAVRGRVVLGALALPHKPAQGIQQGLLGSLAPAERAARAVRLAWAGLAGVIQRASSARN